MKKKAVPRALTFCDWQLEKRNNNEDELTSICAVHFMLVTQTHSHNKKNHVYISSKDGQKVKHEALIGLIQFIDATYVNVPFKDDFFMVKGRSRPPILKFCSLSLLCILEAKIMVCRL